ncbi:tcdA/TcdB catalytic glycosyltransferase domain protein, partial [Escherichia coli 97.0010]
SRRY